MDITSNEKNAYFGVSSFIFVPAIRPEYIDKAFFKGASDVIFDLEDAISPDQKEDARRVVLEYDKKGDSRNIWLRVNASDTPYFKDDLLLAEKLKHIVGIVLPKVESATEIEEVHGRTGRSIIPMVETAKSLINLPKIASTNGIERLTYGRLDIANDHRVDPNSEAADVLFDYIRVQLLTHSAANGLQSPLDSIYPDFKDVDGISKYITHWYDLGFSGMLCIHPNQVVMINEKLRPRPEEIAFAKRVLDEHRRTGSSAFQIDGYMVDTPVIKRAEAILKRFDCDAEGTS